MRYHIPAYTVALVREGSVDVSSYPSMRFPQAAVEMFRSQLLDNGVEQMAVALLNVRHKIIGIVTVSSGCLTSNLTHPREVFAPAIVHKAAAIVLAHNHPSGDPNPSQEDRAMTSRLKSCGTLLGIEVLDHLVLADGTVNYVSMKERGLL